jgi:hypothetical protein
VPSVLNQQELAGVRNGCGASNNYRMMVGGYATGRSFRVSKRVNVTLGPINTSGLVHLSIFLSPSATLRQPTPLAPDRRAPDRVPQY